MHIAFVPQDSHQRRGQNDLSTDVVVLVGFVVKLCSHSTLSL